MSESTNISWADSTASPWFGCTEVSPGCANCYARELTEQKFGFVNGENAGFMRLAYKRDGIKDWATTPVWGNKAPRVRSKGFEKNVRALSRKPYICGCCDQAFTPEEAATHRHNGGVIIPAFRKRRLFPSLMDWLDPQVPIEWLADFLRIVYETPNLDWLLLTKRPELWQARMGFVLFNCDCTGFEYALQEWLAGRFIPGNVWIGATVEDQKRADERIPELLKIPARVRWLSVEPLLEDIHLHYACFNGADSFGSMPGIDWVVVGGESGGKRRDCGVDAIIDVAIQCQPAGVPVWVKQDCAHKPGQQGRIPDNIWSIKQIPQ